MSAPIPRLLPRTSPTITPTTASASAVRSPPTSVKSNAGTLAGRSGYERRSKRSRSAGRTAEGGTARSGFDARPTVSQRPRTTRSSPARTASTVTVTRAARPAHSVGGLSEERAASLHRPERFLADLAPELRAQRDELGRLHRARVVHGKLQDRLDPPGAGRGAPSRSSAGAPPQSPRARGRTPRSRAPCARERGPGPGTRSRRGPGRGQ